MSRPISDEHAHRLKAATRDLIKLAGGLARAAEVALVSTSHLSRWQSAESDDLITIAAALALEAETGIASVTSVMAGINGRTVSAGTGEPVTSPACVLRQHADIVQEAGQLMVQVSDACADGQLTPGEIERLDRQLGALDTATEKFRNGLSAAKARGATLAVIGGR